jgi:3'-phosphoadenosine 5'-phosphosulfate sulfotransferase (PAPS reductase)/FAD synthetase
VHLIGLRAEESRGRLMNRRAHGVLYPRGDGRWIATPLADWTALDVFAYLVSNDLPVSQEYLDPGDTAEERGRRRTGTALGTTNTGYGRWHELRVRHRALWQELVTMFPEMRHDS